MGQINVFVPELPGVSAETVQALQAKRLEVEQGCDPTAYTALADAFAGIGMIAAANRLLERACHCQREAMPCHA